MSGLSVRKVWGVGPKLEQKFESLGIRTCADLQKLPRLELQQLCGSFGAELYDLCRGIDHRPVEPDRPRKSLSTEETFPSDLTSLPECEEQTGHLVEELLAELAEKEPSRKVTKAFVKLKFSDFTRTTVERAGAELTFAIFPRAPERSLRAREQSRSVSSASACASPKLAIRRKRNCRCCEGAGGSTRPPGAQGTAATQPPNFRRSATR